MRRVTALLWAAPIVLVTQCSTTDSSGPGAGIDPSAASATSITSDRADDPYRSEILTPDGGDVYRIDESADRVTVTAPTTNRSGNLRLVAVRDGLEPSVDQESCITWSGPLHASVQPGVALRVSGAPDDTRAITVSNNVWMLNRRDINVHLAKTAEGPVSDQMTLVGKVALPSALGADVYSQKPLPWRMCARANGTTVEVKAWSTAEQTDEPSWDDPRFAGAVPVPADWVYPGRPGWYAGHLGPGEQIHYGDDVAGALAPEAGAR
ncbi:hypothetical protein BH23ACT2_BH23ACT2_12000 [soil metagenome]